jgi:HPt (histidine-containing phosphotransfer) domain-containing protein
MFDMTSDFEKKLLAGAAYKIFFEELQKHISATATLFESTDWSPEQLKEAIGRFHTIRGSAGFFKFTTLAKTAGELEVLLQEQGSAGLAGRLDHLRSLYKQLSDAAAAIPAPQQS